MPNEELFSGIPQLDDTEGLNNFMANQAAAQAAPEANVPTMLQQNQPATEESNATPEANAQQPAMYTAEQVQQIIANQMANINAQNNARMQQQAQMQNANAGGYTSYQRYLITELINRGVPLEKIQEAINSGKQSNALDNRVAALERAQQEERIAVERNAFVEKMNAFGEKFGLSERELTIFANKALENGVNLIYTPNVEAVFRGMYPEQYAIRSQRLANNPAPTFYGGSAVAEQPRAYASKAEDAYVENFLKGAMPNQYGMNTK